MSVHHFRFTTPLALLVLLLGACSDATGPAPAEPTVAAASAAGADVYAYSFDYQAVVQVPLGDVVTECLAEPIEVHANGQFRVMLAQMPGGQRSLASVQMNDMGSWALGLGTGTVYRLMGTSIDRTGDGVLVHEDGASTGSMSGFQQYVGPGGTSFRARSSYGFSITPDGTLTVERNSTTIECS